MNMEEIKKSVVLEISKMIEQAEGTILLENSLIEDLDLSSLEIMTLLGTLSEKHGVKFEEAELRNIDTVNDMAECLATKLK